MKASNGNTAPVVLTYGACAAALAANGFTPVSATRPDGALSDLYGRMTMTALPDYAISEDPAGVRLGRGVALLVLHLSPVEDADLRQRTLALLAGLKLLDGPCRIGADDRRCYPVRCDATRRRSVLSGAVELHISGTLPLDAEWRNATLIDTPIADLPQLDDPEQLFEPMGPLASLPYSLAEERLPPPMPHVRGWLGEASS